MQPTYGLGLLLAACIILLASVRHTGAFNVERSKRSSLQADPLLEIAVLEDLIHSLQQDMHDSSKRRFDGGYGSRYRAAQSVGSKLMALKQAADWNGPGRKRRDLELES